MGVVQEMCARLGAATGRGLLELVRERFGIGWAIFAVAVVLAIGLRGRRVQAESRQAKFFEGALQGALRREIEARVDHPETGWVVAD